MTIMDYRSFCLKTATHKVYTCHQKSSLEGINSSQIKASSYGILSVGKKGEDVYVD